MNRQHPRPGQLVAGLFVEAVAQRIEERFVESVAEIVADAIVREAPGALSLGTH